MRKSFFSLTLSSMLFALSLVVALLLALCLPAWAQQPNKLTRIGHLSLLDPATDSWAEGIRAALRERGYIEGENIAFEYRHTEGKRDRALELAAELVRLKVDIIVVASGDQLVRTRPRRFPSS